MPEEERADLDDGDAVDLTDRFAVGIDEKAPLPDGFERFRVQATEPPDSLIQRMLHVDVADNFAAGGAREVIGLTQYVIHAAQVNRPLARLSREPRAVLDKARYGRCIEGP